MSSADPAYNPRARPRPTLSCLTCRRKKLKCDREHPCVQCVKSGRADECNYASNAEFADEEVLLSGLTKKRARSDDASSLDLPLGLANVVGNLQSRIAELEKRALLGGPREHSSRASSGASAEPLVHAGSNTQLRPEDRLDVKPDGRSRYKTGFKPELRAHFSGALKQLVDVARQDQSLYSSIKDVQKLQKAAYKSIYQKRVQYWPTSNPLDHMADSLPDSDTMRAIIDRYFDLWAEDIQVLHYRTFRDAYADFVPREERTSWMTPLLFALVAHHQALKTTCEAMGMAWEQVPLEDSIGEATATDRCQLLRVHLVSLPRKVRVDITTLQTHLLLIKTERLLFTPPDVLWQNFGVVERMAISMGLHVDVSSAKNFTAVQKSTRAKVWSAILKLDLQLSVEAQMQPQTHLHANGSGINQALLHGDDRVAWSQEMARDLLEKMLRLHRDCHRDWRSFATWHIFLSENRSELSRAVLLLLLPGPSDGANRRRTLVQDAIECIAATIGVFGGDVKDDVLFQTAVLDAGDAEAMRQNLHHVLGIAQQSLTSYSVASDHQASGADASTEQLVESGHPDLQDIFPELFELDRFGVEMEFILSPSQV